MRLEEVEESLACVTDAGHDVAVLYQANAGRLSAMCAKTDDLSIEPLYPYIVDDAVDRCHVDLDIRVRLQQLLQTCGAHEADKTHHRQVSKKSP